MTKNTRSILQISSLFVAIGFLALGYGMIFTYIGIYLKGQHVSNAAIGMINASFFLGSIASSIFSQKIISQVGHIRSFSAFASVMVVTFLLQTLFFNEILWGVLRFFAGIFVGGLFTMVPVYVLTQFHSVGVVSYFMIMTLLGGLLSQWPIGMLSDKFGRRRLIAGCGFFTAMVSILFLFAVHNVLIIYILGFLFGFAMFSIYPLGVARANDVVDENKNIVEISRALLFVYGIGSFLAPAIMGFLMEYFQGAVFVIFALLGLFLTFYALSKKRVADDDMSVFVTMPATSGAELSQLDPRVP